VLRTAYPDIGFDVLALGMLLAIALSVVSYWTLERPFRTRRLLPRRAWIFALSVVSTLSFGVLSVVNYLPYISTFKSSISVAVRGLLYGPNIGTALFVLHDAGGNVARLDVNYGGNAGDYDKARYAGFPCSYDSGNSLDRIVTCLTAQATDFSVLVIGDSIGRDTLHALRIGYPDVNIIMLHQSSCPPADVAWPNSSHCFAISQRRVAPLQRHRQP
jgi:hypothetical protein